MIETRPDGSRWRIERRNGVEHWELLGGGQLIYRVCGQPLRYYTGPAATRRTAATRPRPARRTGRPSWWLE
jgi:hypothetical protein